MLKRDGDEGRLMKRIQSQEHTRFMSEIHELSEANEFLKGYKLKKVGNFHKLEFILSVCKKRNFLKMSS